MKDKLIIDEDRYVYRIRWYLADDDCPGATIGESLYAIVDLDKADEESRIHIAATLAVQALNPERDSQGFYWETERAAKLALRAANAGIAGAPWPEWALKAQSEGWKPPKGWKP